jgi:chromosome partitioning protein
MRILAVLGPKGGIGKTTIAANLLVAARMKGLDAAGLDLDGQGTFARWAVKRAADGRHPEATVATGALGAWREALPVSRLAVLDTPPGMAGAEIYDLAAAADLILVPVPPHEMALEAVGELGRVLRATFVLNMVDRSPEVAAARRHLARLSNLCPVEIPDRVDIRRETGAGGSAVERPRVAGAAEIAALWRWTAAKIGLD